MQNYKPGAICFNRLWTSSVPIFLNSPSHLKYMVCMTDNKLIYIYVNIDTSE